MMMLAPSLGRDAAHKLLKEATRRSLAEGRRLIDVLAGMPEVTRHLPIDALGDLDSPGAYLGMAEKFRRRLISSTE